MVLFGNKQILFSDKVKKINQSEWSQDRFLVITVDSIFNVKNKKVQRTFHIAKLSGFSKNTMGKKKEFTLHLSDEYDYRFIYEK